MNKLFSEHMNHLSTKYLFLLFMMSNFQDLYRLL